MRSGVYKVVSSPKHETTPDVMSSNCYLCLSKTDHFAYLKSRILDKQSSRFIPKSPQGSGTPLNFKLLINKQKISHELYEVRPLFFLSFSLSVVYHAIPRLEIETLHFLQFTLECTLLRASQCLRSARVTKNSS